MLNVLKLHNNVRLETFKYIVMDLDNGMIYHTLDETLVKQCSLDLKSL